MKVCEHQVQQSHTFCRVYEWLYGQDDNSSTVQIMVIFVSQGLLALVSKSDMEM